MNKLAHLPICPLGTTLSLALFACGESDDSVGVQPLQPEDAPEVEIDRFAAGVDNLAFDRVDSVASIETASVLARGVANVNCPEVEVQN